MGRYIDWGDVTNVYPSVIKDKDATLGARYVTDAEGEVDARLGARYAVPFVPGSSNVPQIVRTLSIDIAYYRCTWQQKGSKTLKDYIDERFKALLDGSMALVTSAGVLDPSLTGGAWVSTPHRSSFGIDRPENWSVSDAAQDDAAEERVGD